MKKDDPGEKPGADVHVKFQAAVIFDGHPVVPQLTSGMRPKVRFPDMALNTFFITGEFTVIEDIAHGTEGLTTFGVISDLPNLSRFTAGAAFEVFGSPIKRIGRGIIVEIIPTLVGR
jgi:hypothetical protein